MRHHVFFQFQSFAFKALLILIVLLSVQRNVLCQDLAVVETPNLEGHIKIEGSTPQPAGIVANTIYQIQSATSSKMFNVKDGSLEAGVGVLQNDNNNSNAQKFTFVPLGNDFYNIVTSNGLYLSVAFNAQNSTTGSTTGNQWILVQDKQYLKTPFCGRVATDKCPYHQSWKLIPTSKNNSFIIQSAAFSNPNFVLQPNDNNALSSIVLQPYTGANNQRWNIAEPGDLALSPNASTAEVVNFRDINAYQMGVAVTLENANTPPIYFHQSNGQIYKYRKKIDINQLPESAVKKTLEELKLGNKASELFVQAFTSIGTLRLIAETIGKLLGPTYKDVDCWYPVSEYRKTLCGKLEQDAFLCPQDQLHTELTVDLDYNFDIIPNPKFSYLLRNSWIPATHEPFTKLEAEVKPAQRAKPTYLPKDPNLLLKANQEVCVHGPWMADILNYVIGERYNNEIHPINQLWYKQGNKTQLMSIADETNYFDKTGGGEVEASGLNQAMRYYVAFEIPNTVLTAPETTKKIEYNIQSVGVDFANTPSRDHRLGEELFLKFGGNVRFQVMSKSAGQKNHKISVEKIRKRSDGSIQGYIVVETERITLKGGSINVFITSVTN